MDAVVEVVDVDELNISRFETERSNLKKLKRQVFVTHCSKTKGRCSKLKRERFGM